jgi:outer membrane protein assembly factor BamB
MSGSQFVTRRWRVASATAAVAAVALLAGAGWGGVAAAAPSQPAVHRGPTSADWAGYLNGPQHTSYNPAEKTITAANAAKLQTRWERIDISFLASPTVADGSVFVGSADGEFYKFGLKHGATQAKVFLGLVPKGTCSDPIGVADTATVAVDPRSHQDTVYVGGADGYLHALNASNLTQRWKSVIALPSKTGSTYFDWSSPTIANGVIYIGVSSDCSNPLVRGAVIAYSQATGKKLAETYMVPAGRVGGGVWSSVGVAPGGDVYATVGSGPMTGNVRLGHSESIVKLAPKTLKVLGAWQIPGPPVSYDTDFGASPVFFGPYVGACNKDGIFYAVRQSDMKLAWQRTVRYNSAVLAECSATPVYNGKDLFFGGTGVKINGKSYRGSVQERVASSGKLVWETGLPEGVIGSPTMDGAGVIAVGTFDDGPTTNQTYLVKAANGKILKDLTSGEDWSQSVFADGVLVTANLGDIIAWQPRT